MIYVAGYMVVAAVFAFLCTIYWGVRGAIAVYALGPIVPIFLEEKGELWRLFDTNALIALQNAAFPIAYWWMATFVAAAFALFIRPHLNVGDQSPKRSD